MSLELHLRFGSQARLEQVVSCGWKRLFRGRTLPLQFIVTAIFLAVLSIASPCRAQSSNPGPPPDGTYFDGYDWASFSVLPEALATIDLDKVDYELLSAAVFHRVNKLRVKNGRAPFKYDAVLYKAAAKHAVYMANNDYVGHTEDIAGMETVADRAVTEGIAYSYVSENVADEFGRKYKSGSPYYILPNNLPSYEPEGKPIPRHTYVSFARAIAKAWWNSPPHKANILGAADFSAVAAALRTQNAMPMFYVTQDFYVPVP